MSQTGFNFTMPAAITAPIGDLPPLPRLREAPAICFDTETTTEPLLFDRTLVGLSYYVPNGGPKGYVPLRHPDSKNYPIENVFNWINGEFRGRELIVANAKHEHHTMKKAGVDFEVLGVKFDDVFHQAALVDEKRYKVNLSLLAQDELGITRVEVDHTKFWQMPAHLVADAAVEDAELTWLLREKFLPRIYAEDLQRVLTLENDLTWSTCEMERNGSFIDIPLAIKWEAEVRAEHTARVQRIYNETGLAVNPNSPDDMTKLFNYLGIRNKFKTDQGNDSFGEEQLLEYVHLHPLIWTALESRQLHSLWSKYLKKYLASVQPDGRLYYALHQLRSDEGGTITGRYSSSAMFKKTGGGINIQQVVKTKKMPKFLQRWPIRKLFIAPPGERFFSSDASQIEFRLFAHYAKKHGMPRVADKYCELPLLWPDGPKKGKPRVDFHEVVMQWTGQIRDITKNINFRKLYGGGAKKGMIMINQQNKMDGRPPITLDEAYEMDNKYDAEFPESKRLLQMAEKQAKNLGYIKTLLGRRCRFNTDDENERFYKALNMVLQGGATGDLVKLKIQHMYRERKNLEITMRSQVHDEINGNVPGDPKLDARRAEFMNEQEFELHAPILWETGVGANWEEAH